MPSTSFHIVNLGCKVNRVEADTISAALIGAGHVVVDEEAADLVIVNTCTVTGEADKKARKAARHALAVNPIARIIVTGCAAAITPDVFLAMSPRVTVRGKAELLESLEADGNPTLLRTGEPFRTRVGIKVQDGCDHACTYCIVHVARGKAHSMPSDRVIEEARAHFAAGVKEVVLAGIDIGAYRDGDTALAALAKSLIAAADEACPCGQTPARIRISSIEPLSIDDALISMLSKSGGRICRHLHIPLQSGSTRILREMNRPYTAEEYKALVNRLKNAVPDIALSTDVIVGFPGETDEDFKATCDLVRNVGFMRLHVFPYSRREGTPAAKRTDQICPEIKHERASRLRTLGVKLAMKDRKARKGTTELCLVEGSMALTESYHEIPAPENAKAGDLVLCEL